VSLLELLGGEGIETYVSSSPEMSITPAVSRLDDIHMEDEEWIVIVAFVSDMTPRVTL
jgi:hypothetical protein